MDKKEPVEQILFTIEEAARILTISRSGVYRLVEDGSLKTVRIGGCVRFHKAELARFIFESMG